MKVSSIAKSIVSGISAGAAAAVVALQDGSLSVTDDVTILLAVLGAWGITWAIPNKTPAP